MRLRIEVQVELFPPPVGSEELRTGSADCLNGGVHTRPLVKVNLGVSLMVYLRMRALDEGLLFVNWNDDSLP